MENWNTAFYSGFKLTSTCSVICTTFASSLSQYAAYMKETAFLKNVYKIWGEWGIEVEHPSI